MNIIELTERVKERLNNPEASLTSVVQDCLTIARRLDIPEWELYFELQLNGVEIGHDEEYLRPHWKGDPKTLKWQPLSLFMKDRERDNDTIDSHPLESVEFFVREIERARANQEVSPLGDLARHDVFLKLQETESRQQTNEALLAMKRELSLLRTRTRRFISEAEAVPQSRESSPSNPKKHIFIGHGRSKIWTELAMFLHNRLELTYDEFNRTSSAGIPTASRLQEMLDRAEFAFIIFSAEDQQADGSLHARQNVIHEAGLFQGRLGFKKAIILLEDGCEEFSNISGLGQIRFPTGQIMSKAEEIRGVLEREGLL